jgi:hypothetical protein
MPEHDIIYSLLGVTSIAFGLFRIKGGKCYPVSWCPITQSFYAERLLTFVPFSKLKDYLFFYCLQLLIQYILISPASLESISVTYTPKMSWCERKWLP